MRIHVFAEERLLWNCAMRGIVCFGTITPFRDLERGIIVRVGYAVVVTGAMLTSVHEGLQSFPQR